MSVATGEPLAEIESRYDGAGYGQFKEDVGEAVVALFAPIQERYRELRADEAGSARAPRDGAETRARGVRARRSRRCTSAWASSGLARGPTADGARRSATSSAVSSRHSPGLEPVEVEPRVAAAVQLPHRMADRLAHPLHLVLATLVQRQLERLVRVPRPSTRTSAGAVRPSSSSTPSRSSRASRARASPRPRPRRPSARRSADGRAGARDRRRS